MSNQLPQKIRKQLREIFLLTKDKEFVEKLIRICKLFKVQDVKMI